MRDGETGEVVYKETDKDTGESVCVCVCVCACVRACVCVCHFELMMPVTEAPGADI